VKDVVTWMSGGVGGVGHRISAGFINHYEDRELCLDRKVHRQPALWQVSYGETSGDYDARNHGRRVRLKLQRRRRQVLAIVRPSPFWDRFFANLPGGRRRAAPRPSPTRAAPPPPPPPPAPSPATPPPPLPRPWPMECVPSPYISCSNCEGYGYLDRHWLGGYYCPVCLGEGILTPAVLKTRPPVAV